MPKVTIYTQVYNAGDFLDQCVSSVLNQTFPDFQYILVDSASTDGSREKLKSYAALDPRIQLILLPQNQLGVFQDVMGEHARGEYFAHLDHDDWWEPNYLERLLAFAEEHRLDVACTGTCKHYMGTGVQHQEKLEGQLILDREQFADFFPYCFDSFKVLWNKLVRREIALPIYRYKDIPKLPYGRDTLYCFQFLRSSNRIGIDDSVLHHYRMHNKSLIHQYNPKRFDAHVCCYEDEMDFLAAYGPVSQRNQLVVDYIYAHAVRGTSQVIKDSLLTPEEKLKEYRRMAEHPYTQSAYRQQNEQIQVSRLELLEEILQTGKELPEDDGTLQAAVKALCPQCGGAVTPRTLSLLTREGKLLRALLRDDRGGLVDGLMDLIAERKYSRQYDLAALLHSVISEGSPLRTVTDIKFFQAYAEICRAILGGNYIAPLEHMTGLLLEEKRLYGEEQFLRLYITLAALEEQVPAFLFGQIQLAKLYLREARRDECRALLDELTEMGAGEHEEVVALVDILG